MIKKYIKFIITTFLFCITLLNSYRANANDTEGLLAAGGIIPIKNENIKMKSEYLYISKDKIEINYVFENNTNMDIKTIVTFPMPPIPLDSGDDNDNIINFKTLVDGKEVKLNKNIKKIKLNQAKIYNGEYYEDAIQVYFFWRQLFPANKLIKIRHTYSPRVGNGVPQSLNKLFQDIVTDEYCPDNDIKSAIQKKIALGYNDVSLTYVSYILTTGGNWAGGTIGDFHLVVDKGQPDALVSFCGRNVRKINATQFEIKAQNYKPRRDLDIVIMSNWQ